MEGVEKAEQGWSIWDTPMEYGGVNERVRLWLVLPSALAISFDRGSPLTALPLLQFASLSLVRHIPKYPGAVPPAPG